MENSGNSTKHLKRQTNSSRSAPTSLFPLPKKNYRGNEFMINLYDDWQDKTVFTITGPVTDGIQHNITIMVEHDIEVESLRDFADWNVTTLEEQLKGCRVLKQGEINLNNGIPAYKVVYVWYPSEELRLYQEQILLLVDKTSYKLTASFTKKSRKTLGPQVERMMLSFNPIKP
jgi:hypothetical protein